MQKQPRARPILNCTVGSDVDKALRERAERDGRPVSRVVDDALRASLGLVPSPVPATP